MFNLTEKGKKGYLVEICLRSYLVGIWQKKGYPVGICQKFLTDDALSCRNLPESTSFLQDKYPFSTKVGNCIIKSTVRSSIANECCLHLMMTIFLVYQSTHQSTRKKNFKKRKISKLEFYL